MSPRGWGGARPGSGRKPRSGGLVVSHRARPRLDGRHPLLITHQVVDEIPVADQDTWEAIVGAISDRAETSGFELERFGAEGQLLLFVARASNEKALTKAVQGLSIRIARGVNRTLDRSGRVFRQRYLAEPLNTQAALREARKRTHLAS